MTVGDQVSRWTLLYSARNAAGRTLWVCQCKCLRIREIREAALTPRARCWGCGHRSAPTTGAKSGRSSKFRGVCYDSFRRLAKPWRVALQVQGQHYYVGRFAAEEEAGRAYDEAALVLLGPTAPLNFLELERKED
jgi:AP2 domain